MCVCLRTSTPVVEDDQDIGESNASVTIDIGGAVLIRNTVAPGIDDRQDVVHINEAVTVGVGAFALIRDAVVVGVLGGAEGDVINIADAVLVAVDQIWNIEDVRATGCCP